uniref:Centrosomin N-terminal motif 1 domain-containing protein n=1 Tax=Salvator merianae TaxID=96440 RepID=A0A8D0EFM4_SALMN
MQPQIFSYFSTLVEMPTIEDFDVACPVMPTIEDLVCPMVQKQPTVLGHLEAAPVEDHLPGDFEQSSTAPTQTLRDFEKHLNDLKKENFSLKLRIYFLEERMQQKYEATKEDVYRQKHM